MQDKLSNSNFDFKNKKKNRKRIILKRIPIRVVTSSKTKIKFKGQG
jgi:glucokinase